MVIGVPKETKDNEFRVAMVPAGARALKEAGFKVIVEKDAGSGSIIPDNDYEAAGAEIVKTAEEVYSKADLIVKVKEPLEREFKYFKEGQIIFTFFHFASNTSLADELIKKNVTAIAYETVELDDRTLPILTPMSEIAGRLSVQVGAHHLMKAYGGRGVLLSGVPGVERGVVAILGGGIVGLNAAKIAVGLNAEVLLLDNRLERLRYLDDVFGGRIKTLASNAYNVESALRRCELLIGAVHIPGARTAKLITRDMLKLMKKGSVIVDVSVDQGGCVETIRPTTHTNPVFEVDGIVHYGVSNMPGAVPRTSTFALTNATTPYIIKLARSGFKGAIEADPSLKRGVNIHNSHVTHKTVAEALNRDYRPL